MLSLSGMYKADWIYAVIGTSGVVLGAWYMLTMVQHGFFGPLREPHDVHDPVTDMTPRELCAFLPLGAMCVWIGVMPQTFIDFMKPDIQAVVQTYDGSKPSTVESGIQPSSQLAVK